MERALRKSEQRRTLHEPYLLIQGGNPLSGEVHLPGAKNSALPSIVAACLSEDEVTLDNVPLELNDVNQLIKLLVDIGAEIRISGNSLVCRGRGWKGGTLNAEMAGKIRHSLLLLGAAAHWRSPLFLPLPGGCSIGNRKHDLHLAALQQIGFQVEESDLGIHVAPSEPHQEVTISQAYPTFGGTLNVLFASVRSHAVVTLHNAARNPEVQDVIRLLIQMGARIEWLAPAVLRITGVERLSGAKHNVMSDRIIASTVISAVAATKGRATIHNATTQVLTAEVDVWREAGLTIEEGDNRIQAEWTRPLKAIDVTTAAYPGFHTDIQPLHTVMMILAGGRCSLKETILDGRFAYCYELNKLGAQIEVKDGDFTCVNGAPGQIAYIQGVERLTGNDLIATDIRGGAAVAVAALAAHGVSRITNLYQLERGYGNFVPLFRSLGANIKRVTP